MSCNITAEKQTPRVCECVVISRVQAADPGRAQLVHVAANVSSAGGGASVMALS